MDADLIIHSAAQLLTLAGGPQRGRELGRLAIIEDGAVAVANGKILAVGASSDMRRTYAAPEEIDAAGQVVLPGFVDAHTHLVWAGDRAAEFEQRIAGASYMEIMAAGGGIASTVTKTRQASVEDLMREARPRLTRMLRHGTTTAEAKTGYGLETEAELRMLEVILRLDKEGPVRLVPTFLGAHAVPPEFQDHPQAYVDKVCGEMLPAVREWWNLHASTRRLPFVDVFCEAGAFDLEQTRRILETARRLGFPLKVHADEFASLGGTRLAVDMGAASADHLVHTTRSDIEALGLGSTVAVALPATPFGLGETRFTPAKEILAAGGLLALASDLNPGTAWCENMQFIIALACRTMRLTPAQAIAASTINAAAAIGHEAHVGSLEPGKEADVLILDFPDYRHLGYRFGTNLAAHVLRAGRVVA
ncbi:MAG TPA: imidazolonepropionase [Anaerolineales bacterium]|nr:imidazolonepropionase [Anaerolineales bacterium]